MKDILFFLFFFGLPFTVAMSADALWNYINSCTHRVRSRSAARARLEALKRREAYELATYRFKDPHYFGD